MTGERPMPGDAVRLTEDWHEARAGSVGFIDGMVGQYQVHAGITFNASVFRDDVVVSCSGGPASIVTDLRWLRSTGDTVTAQAWRWRDGHRGRDNGEDYSLVVPLWEWTPSQARCHLCGRDRDYGRARSQNDLLCRLDSAVHALTEVNHAGIEVSDDIDNLDEVFREYRAALLGGDP